MTIKLSVLNILRASKCRQLRKGESSIDKIENVNKTSTPGTANTPHINSNSKIKAFV